jgi:GNAT superfamily N-acetyltransferase
MNTLNIRRATLADADTIVAFNSAIAEETEGQPLPPEVIGRGVRRLLSDPSLGVYYVAERDGSPVGQLMVTTEFSDWRDGVFWWIQSVYVVPAARRTGVYRALHEHVAREARAAGNVCGLRLYTDQANNVAQEVYRHMGMTPARYVMYEVDWRRAK